MKQKQITWLVTIIILSLLLLTSIIVSLSIGEINLSLPNLIHILSTKSGIEYTILSKVRLPRILLGLAVGGSLSLSGAILQGIYRNPLVEPYTMGISGGAALGVAIAITFGLNLHLGSYILPIFGFSGAFIMSSKRRKLNINKMLLIGVMISFIASSAIMFLMATTTSENLQSIIFWIMGSLDNPDLTLIKIALYASIIGLFVTYLFANPLNALHIGESKAKHLGINTQLSISILYIITSILTGISVAITGVIGFVGLVIPHIMRLIIGSDYRILLISSFLGGGIFIILCDLISRTIIAPNELPIGVITGLIGGVIFIIALSKHKNIIS